MGINALIAEIQGRLTRLRTYNAAFLVGGGISYGILLAVLSARYSLGMACVCGALVFAAALILAWRSGLFSQASEIEAAEFIDARFATRGRAVSFVDLRGVSAEPDGRVDFIERQLESSVPAFRVEEVIPLTLSKPLQQFSYSIPPIWAVIFMLLFFGWLSAPKYISSEARKIEELLNSEEHLPDELRKKMEELAKSLDQPIPDSQKVQEALAAAEQELSSALQQTGEGENGRGENLKEITPPASRKKEMLQATPTPPPQQEAKDKPKDKQEANKDKQEGEKKDSHDQAGTGEQNEKQQDQKKEGAGQSGEKAEKESDQGKSDGDQGKNDQGEQGQGSQGSSGSGKEEGKEKGKGEGSQDQQASESGSGGKAGEKGASTGKDQQAAEGKESKEKGTKEGEQGSQSGDKVGKGGESQTQQALDKAQQTLDQVKKDLDKKGDSQSKDGKSGNKPDPQGNQKQQAEQGSDNKSGKEGGQKGEKAEGDKAGGQGDKKGEKPQGQGAQEGESEKTQQQNKEAGTHGAQDAAEDQKQKAGGDKDANKSSLPTADEAKKSAGGLGEKPSELQGEKGFKETEVKPGDEKLDLSKTSAEGELARNPNEARPRTDLADVQLARPEAAKEKSSQPIPLEYEDLMQ